MMLPVAARRNRATRRAAFTLLEVLVVVAILVILAGVASISVFKYLEKAKIGRAKADMETLVKAYKTFYTQNLRWPENPTEVTSLLEQGNEALRDPWGNAYQIQVMPYQLPDGTTGERPVATCTPANGEPAFTIPDLAAGR
jgi:general secretion pathway protein G